MAGETPIRYEPYEIDWKFELSGRSWKAGEARPRYEMTPEKLEMIEGKLLWSEEDRLRLLGLLLENCGLRAAVHLGNPAQWRDAVSELGDNSLEFLFAKQRVHRLWDLTDEGANPDDVARYYNRWMTPDFVEAGADGARRNRAERIAAALPEFDRERWVEIATEMTSYSQSEKEATLVAVRTRIEHPQGSQPEEFTEVWRENWQNVDGWKVAFREFLTDAFACGIGAGE